MSITREEVLKIAELSRLHFDEKELEVFAVQFQSILDYIEQLREADVDNVEPTSHVSLRPDFDAHMFREDAVRPSLTAETSLAGAPDSASGHFRVPKVI